MKLILFIVILLVLGIIMVPLKDYASFGETELSTIAGIDDWMPMVFTVIPIVVPLAIIVVAIISITKGRKKESGNE